MKPLALCALLLTTSCTSFYETVFVPDAPMARACAAKADSIAIYKHQCIAMSDQGTPLFNEWASTLGNGGARIVPTPEQNAYIMAHQEEQNAPHEEIRHYGPSGLPAASAPPLYGWGHGGSSYPGFGGR